jgi:hypothetical protein
MWEYWSWPQWIYRTPGAQIPHGFEMPLPGCARPHIFRVIWHDSWLNSFRQFNGF